MSMFGKIFERYLEEYSEMTDKQYLEYVSKGIDAVYKHIKSRSSQGIVYSNWYVGVTDDLEERVYGYHKVEKDDKDLITHETKHTAIAQGIEIYFTELKGTEGGPGGAKSDSVYVYAYKKTKDTKE